MKTTWVVTQPDEDHMTFGSHITRHILNSQQNQNQINQILHLLHSVKSKSWKKRLLVTDRSESHLHDIVFQNVYF